MIVITTDSPETGWAPFVQWMDDQGIDPCQIRRLTLHPRTMQAYVIEYDLDERGRRYRDKRGRSALTFRVVGYTSDPPRLTGDCEQDCQERCAHPGIDSACEIDQ